MRNLLVSLLALASPLAPVLAQPAASGPAVTFGLGPRQGQVIPHRQGFTHTGGGNIDVAQPAPDTLVITMTGVCIAGGHPCKDSLATLTFDLRQSFEVVFEKPEIKSAKLTIEGRAIGLLRSHAKGCGSAQNGPAYAGVLCGPEEILALALPLHTVSAGQNLSVNDREGPLASVVPAGTYELHQTFSLSASHPRSLKLCKSVSTEFAPDPALDPLWISYWEPFHGAIKKDFGFQVTLKVSPHTIANADKEK